MFIATGSVKLTSDCLLFSPQRIEVYASRYTLSALFTAYVIHTRRLACVEAQKSLRLFTLSLQVFRKADIQV